MTKALRGLAIKTPWLKTVTKILLAGALAATCFNVALAGPYEDGVAAMNNMEDEKASAYNDNAKRQLQAISGYSPPLCRPNLSAAGLSKWRLMPTIVQRSPEYIIHQ